MVPVICLNDKYICRSSTIAISADATIRNVQSKAAEIYSYFSGSDDQVKTSFDLEKQRRADIHLLMKLNVKFICDLMVESQKKVYGLKVTSSEKAEKYRYSDFFLNEMPYPGCEFFKVFRDSGYIGWCQEMPFLIRCSGRTQIQLGSRLCER